MSTSEFEALRRANPRLRDGFMNSVEHVSDTVNARIVSASEERRPRRRLIGLSATAVAAAAAAVAAFLVVGPPGGGTGVENARAAVKRAANLSAASAERSGVAVVRMTNDGQAWAETTVRWHGNDVSISKDGLPLLVVDGKLYGHDPELGGWINFGSPSVIDPDSGTTPAEYLAAVREDVGGDTLRRITGGLRGLSTRRLADGSAVYDATVPAGMLARETGFKEGHAIRVFPFGYVAHDAAAVARNLLDVALTVGADGIVREVAVTWPGWTYTVTYSGLGESPAIAAPANARPISKLRDPSR